ncbi:MAG: thioredoxin family protein [Fimbriimonadaceae bacterium]
MVSAMWKFVPLAVALALLAGCGPQLTDTAAKTTDEPATASTPVEVPQAQPAATTEPVAEVPKPAGAKLVWAKSVDEAKAIAKKEGKYVVMKFEAEWCGPCQLMKKEAFNDPDVVAKLEDAVIVAIDIDKKETMELQQKYQVANIPRLVFADATGKSFGDVMGYDTVDTFKVHLDRALANR